MLVFIALNDVAIAYQRVGKLMFCILALINLGGCYRESGKLEKSLSSMKEGVAISRSCNSFPHSSLALGKKS